MRAEDYEPYGRISINLARENLSSLLEGLERKGEEVYLSEGFWLYEHQYREEMEEVEEKVFEVVEEGLLNFFGSTAEEKRVLEMLGREETYLAVPEIYLGEVLSLYKKLEELRGSRGYEERSRICRDQELPRPRIALRPQEEGGVSRGAGLLDD